MLISPCCNRISPIFVPAAMLRPHFSIDGSARRPERPGHRLGGHERTPADRQPSLAESVISALSTREIGQPAFAVWAASSKAAWLALGTLATVSRWILVMVGLPSFGSKVRFALVSTDSGVKPALPSSADRAMEKQEACAAAISSSGFVPGAFSKRWAKV